MKRICPNPMAWSEVHERLSSFAKTRSCTPPSPPKPLILSGWIFSNDVEKLQRWEETVAWAIANDCRRVVEQVPEDDFYFVTEPTTYTVGPAGSPMYRRWDFDAKYRPSAEDLSRYFETLKSHWPEIVGTELASITRPAAFSGEKARRLLVFVKYSTRPPWGDWSHLSSLESERRTFTRFRLAVNNAIAPHEVDHVDFTTDTDPIVPGYGS